MADGIHMAGARRALTLWEALKDLGWLPFLLMGVGGLSIIDILERVAFHDLSLIAPFEIMLNGYRRITNLTGALAEPLLQPAIDWINAQWLQHFHLHPLWRSMFVLQLVFVGSVARMSVRAGMWRDMVVQMVVLGLGALAAAVVTGVLPWTGGWSVQGLIAAVPATILVVTNGLLISMTAYASADTFKPRYLFVRFCAFGLMVGIVAFLAGAGASFLLGGYPGVLVLAGLILLYGLFVLSAGLRIGSRANCRLGLSILGGFIGAGLILVSNWAVTVAS